MTDQDGRPAATMVISGRIRPGDAPGLCRRLLRLLPALAAGDVVCDVEGVVEADAVTVDALARLQLTARRCGRRVRLRNASGPLRELLDLVGLGEVVPLCRDSGVQAGWQAEAREDRRGVEERVEADDLAP